MSSTYPKGRITLREVGLRDGLQMVRTFPSTRAKQEWLTREHAAGVRHFEIGSFLPPARFPQFADIREIAALASRLGVFSTALALNERGAGDAIATSVDEIVVVVSATEEHSQANMRRSRVAAVELLRQTRQMADDAEDPPLVSVGISMAFGCSIAGNVAPDEVLRIAGDCIEAGADVICLADTVGYAAPRQVGDLTAKAVKLCGDALPVAVHLHDTRGLGIANAAASLDAGAQLLDGSLGGLGGCPFAPGATGNVVFEDLVFLCERMGFPTGIDIEALCAVREILTAEMPLEPVYGALARSGPPRHIAWSAV
ncbi:MAG: hydroxymethylglutaryl-CoA lyase [Rhodobacteraceae bacterium]|nr:hydroxymethylglutaryl-CoA lyase [Paracoccaceae bacterium]